MKRILTLGTIVAALALVGTVDTARADHCSSYGRSPSFGYSNYSSRSYSPRYSQPSYGYGGYGYSRPSSGIYYSRPGFSISIGSGYRSSGFSRYRSRGSVFGGHSGHRH